MAGAGSTGLGCAIADTRGVLVHQDAVFAQASRQEWSGWRGHALPADALQALQRDARAFQGRTLVLRARLEHGLLFLRARPLVPADRLTERERAVARLLAGGLTHKEAAQRLGRAPATVRNQIASAYGKLGVDNVVALAVELQRME